MALKGLAYPIWIGWISGVLVLKRPWGTPSLPSWFTFSTIYCFIGLTIYIFIVVDSLFNNSDSLTLGDEDSFGKYVRAFNLLQYVVNTFFKRFVFFVNAKPIAKLLQVLSDYDKDNPPKKENGRKLFFWGWRKRSLLIPILIVASFMIAIFLIIERGVEFITINTGKPSWFTMLGMGTLGYSILFFVFSVLPLSTVSNIANAIILVTTVKVTKIYCEFCSDVKDSLHAIISGDGVNRDRDRSSLEIYNILKMGTKLNWQKKNIAFSKIGRRSNKVTCSKADEVHEVQLSTPVVKYYSRQEVIDKFEELKELMRLTTEALSGLMMLMISGMTLGMVSDASTIFLMGSQNAMNLINDLFTFALLSIYAMLLELGHRIGRMQRAAKLQLHRELLNTPWSPGKDEIEDVIQSIVQFEWKLSACGFFYVDRRLASGIFSLVLNYVVILVQLNIALTETPPTSCYNGTQFRNMSSIPISALEQSHL